MKKLLVICGPTATGKTSLALRLAKKFSGELVSADSRQVYKWMNIGTGKDIPKGFEFRISNLGFESGEVGYYANGDTRIWGYDLIDPIEEFSVGQYVTIANNIIKDIWERNKLPILVGGTGLYIKGVVDGIPTADIPKSLSLREQYKKRSINELQEILGSIDPFRLASMNMSDRKNPRRLVRAIEISSSKFKNKQSLAFQAKNSKLGADVLFIGLTANKGYLDRKIEERVERRIREGFENEIIQLLKTGVTWKHQSMQALGYKQWLGLFIRKEKRNETISSWKHAEKQYVKRQITWFKRDKRIKWFDISKSGWKKEVENMVGKWYISINKELK